jgi:hypothetical protein
MFKDNKYSKWYHKIIDNAKHRTTINGYIERHHIIPKSLGGLDGANNIVSLTAREHFVCHFLLTKMTQGTDRRKMLHAAWRMINFDPNCKTDTLYLLEFMNGSKNKMPKHCPALTLVVLLDARENRVPGETKSVRHLKDINPPQNEMPKYLSL